MPAFVRNFVIVLLPLVSFYNKTIILYGMRQTKIYKYMPKLSKCYQEHGKSVTRITNRSSLPHVTIKIFLF